MLLKRFPLLLAVGILGLLPACTPNSSTGDFSVQLSSTNPSLNQGGNQSLNLNLTRNNFAGAIAFSLQQADGSALPGGLNASFAAASVTGNTTSLTLSAAESLAVGSYSLRVRATSGSLEKFYSLSVQVLAKPDFAVSLSNPPASATRGQNLSIPVAISRSNFADPVTLSLELSDASALPEGLGASFDPNPATGEASTLNLSVAAAAALQTHSLQIRASAGSLSKTSAPFTLAVQALPAFALSFAATPSPAIQGQNTLATINIARTNLSDPVTLTLERSDGSALPTGISAAFNASPSIANSSSLTINVASSVAVGEYALRVRGTSSTLSQTLPFTLTVQSPPAFGLSIPTPPSSLLTGQSTTATVNITRTNFTSALTLSLERSDGSALPAGMSATFSPNNTTGNISTLTLNLASTIAPGTYNLRVKAAAGSTANYFSFALNVPDFAMALASPPAAALQGGQTSLTLNINRTAFTGPIALSLEAASGAAAPTGITAAFSPNNTSGNTSTVTLSVSSAVTAGTYALRIKGVWVATALTKTLAFNLTVLANSDFSLSLPSSTLSASPGGSAIQTITITRTNFADPVTLSLEQSTGAALPTGINASFASNPTSASNTTLTLNVASSLSSGSYTLRVKGVSGGTTKYSSNFTLQIASNSGVSVRQILTSTYTAPWAAFQDGSGAWQTITPTSGTYTFSVSDPQGRYGFATICHQTSVTSLQIYQFTTADTRDFNVACGRVGSYESPSYSITGTVGGFAANSSSAQISTMGMITSATPTSPNYSAGTIGGSSALAASRITTSNVVDKFILIRDLQITQNIVRNLDFSGPEAFSPEGTSTITSSSVIPKSSASFIVPSANTGMLVFLNDSQSTSTFSYSNLPSSKVQPNDYYAVRLEEGDYLSAVGTPRRTTEAYSASPISGALDLPARVSAASTLASPSPYVRIRTTWNAIGNAQLYSVLYSTNSMTWQVYMSAAWLNGTYAYTAPDFSPNPNWQAIWGIPANSLVTWSVGSFESTKGFLTVYRLSSGAYDNNMSTLRSLIIEDVIKGSAISGSIYAGATGASVGGYSLPAFTTPFWR